jgi:hypothetical protein
MQAGPYAFGKGSNVADSNSTFAAWTSNQSGLV